MQESLIYYAFDDGGGDMIHIASWAAEGYNLLPDDGKIPYFKEMDGDSYKVTIWPTNPSACYNFPKQLFYNYTDRGKTVDEIRLINQNGEVGEGKDVNIGCFPYGFLSYKVNKFIYKNTNVDNVIISTGAFFLESNKLSDFHINVPNATLNIEAHGIVFDGNTSGSVINHFLLEGKQLCLPKEAPGLAIKPYTTGSVVGNFHGNTTVEIFKLWFPGGLSSESGKKLLGVSDKKPEGATFGSFYIQIDKYLELYPASLSNECEFVDNVKFWYRKADSTPQLRLFINADIENKQEIINLVKNIDTAHALTDVSIYIMGTYANSLIIKFEGDSNPQDIYINIVDHGAGIENIAQDIWKRAQVNITEGLSKTKYKIENADGEGVTLLVENNLVSQGAKYRNCANNLKQGNNLENCIGFYFDANGGIIPAHFMQNTKIQDLKIFSPGGKISIGQDAFKQCTNLQTITINCKLEENRDSNISSFSEGAESVTLSFGKNVYSIPAGYFGNMNIAKLLFEEACNLQIIQDKAFYNSLIKKIDKCPPKLKTIEQDAFSLTYTRLNEYEKSNPIRAGWYYTTIINNNTENEYFKDFAYKPNTKIDRLEIIVFGNVTISSNGVNCNYAISDENIGFWLLRFYQHFDYLPETVNQYTFTETFTNTRFLLDLPIKGIADDCFGFHTNVEYLKEQSKGITEFSIEGLPVSYSEGTRRDYIFQNNNLQSLGKNIFINISWKLPEEHKDKNGIIQFDFPNLKYIENKGLYFSAEQANQDTWKYSYYYNINTENLIEIKLNSLNYIINTNTNKPYIINVVVLYSSENASQIEKFEKWNNAFVNEHIPYDNIDYSYQQGWDLYIKENDQNTRYDKIILGEEGQTDQLKNLLPEYETEIEDFLDFSGSVLSVQSISKLHTGCLAYNRSIKKYFINLAKIQLEEKSLGPFDAMKDQDNERDLIFINWNSDNNDLQYSPIVQKNKAISNNKYDNFDIIRLPMEALYKWFEPEDKKEFAQCFSGQKQIYSIYLGNENNVNTLIPGRVYPQQPQYLYLPKMMAGNVETDDKLYSLNGQYIQGDVTISPFMGIAAPDNCSDLTELIKVVITDTINIGPQSFANLTKLQEVQLLGKLKLIGTQAFFGCTALKSLKLANTLEKISYSCFLGCTALEQIYYPKNAEDWYNIKFYGLEASPFVNTQAQNPRYYFGENLGEWYNKELTITTKKSNFNDIKLNDYDYCPFYGYTIKGLCLGYLLEDGMGIVERVSDEKYANALGIQYIVFTENSMNNIIDYKVTKGKNYILSEQIKPHQVFEGKYPRLCGIMLDPNLTQLPESFLQDFVNLSNLRQIKIGIPANKIQVLEKGSLSNCFWPLIQLNEEDLKEDELINYIITHYPTSCSFGELKYSNDCGLQINYQQTNDNLETVWEDIDGEKSKIYMFFANGQKNFLIYIDNVTWGQDVPEYLDSLSVINQGCIGNKYFANENPGKEIYGCYIDTLYLPWVGACKDTNYIPPQECFTLYNLLANKQATRIGELTLGNSKISYYFEPKGKINDNQRVFQGIIFGKIDKAGNETNGKVIFAFDQIIGEIANRNHFNDTHTEPNEEGKRWQFDVIVKMKKVPSHLLTRDEQGGEKRWKLHIHNLKFEPVEEGTKNNYVLQSHSVATELIDNIYFEQLKNDNDTLTFENEAFQGVMRANNPPNLLCNHIYFNRPLEEWYQRVNYGATNSNPAQYALELHSENSEGDYEVRREISPSCEEQIVDGKTIYKFIMKNYCLEKNRQIDSIDLYKNLPADKPNDYEVMLVNNINDFSSSTDFGDLSYGLIEVFSGTPHLNNSELQANKFRKNQTETTKESKEKE